MQFTLLLCWGVTWTMGAPHETEESMRIRLTRGRSNDSLTRRSLVTGLVLLSAALPTTAQAVQSAELYRTQAYVYGRFEARVQYAPGDGVISSFFLWKDGSSSTTLWNELDYEKLNADCHMQTNAWTGLGGVQHTQVNAMPGNICTGYHTYSYEWTPTYIAWFVDGCEIRRETGAIAADFATNASAGLTIHFNTWEGNASFGGTLNSSILPVNEYISWVQYSSYVNGAFQLQWREEFDAAGVPSGWAEGNWASPYGLSTHNPANVNYVNGIAILSMTADGATGYSGTPPADPGGPATCGAGTGGAAGTGGSPSTGGSKSTGGTTATGGSKSTGGAAATGGTTSTGGSKSTGGTTVSGGAKSTGGATPTGGTVAAGGSQNTGGTPATSGATSTGGAATTSGGLAATGGGQNTGGIIAAGGSSTAVGSSGGTVAASSGATSSVSAGASAVAGATGGPGTGDNVGSCGCKISESQKSSPIRGAVATLVGFALLLARRARRSRSLV
jgi:endo-1,3-1,4-beta-glycanase ExoK